MADTIRLSDRLELRASGNGEWPWRLLLDGKLLDVYGDDLSEALIALANPPRYDLPPGVIAGSDGKFYAPGDVVRTLPDEMWTRHRTDGSGTYEQVNRFAAKHFYEVRPTAANPLPTLPEHTFRLPDGELACYRRDAAKLREAGAKLRRMDGSLTVAGSDDNWPDMVLLVEFPALPKTERVPWAEALRDEREIQANHPIRVCEMVNGEPRLSWVGGYENGDWWGGAVRIDADGLVEVLATDGAL